MPDTLIISGITEEEGKLLDRMNPKCRKEKEPIETIEEACAAFNVDVEESKKLASELYQFYAKASIAVNEVSGVNEQGEVVERGAAYRYPGESPIAIAGFIMSGERGLPGYEKSAAELKVIKEKFGGQADQLSAAYSAYLRDRFFKEENTVTYFVQDGRIFRVTDEVKAPEGAALYYRMTLMEGQIHEMKNKTTILAWQKDAVVLLHFLKNRGIDPSEITGEALFKFHMIFSGFSNYVGQDIEPLATKYNSVAFGPQKAAWDDAALGVCEHFIELAEAQADQVAEGLSADNEALRARAQNIVGTVFYQQQSSDNQAEESAAPAYELSYRR